MSELIEHSGVVDRVSHGMVWVQIVSQAACGSCKARQACGMSESEQKMIEVSTPHAEAFAVGDRVRVGVARGMGMKAVLLAYVGALVVLVLLLAILVGSGVAEGVSALVAVGGVACYYAALYLCRNRIENIIHFTITKE